MLSCPSLTPNAAVIIMIVDFNIAPRTALAAPTEPFVIQAQSVVILAVSILSVVSGSWMVASFFVSPTGISQANYGKRSQATCGIERPN